MTGQTLLLMLRAQHQDARTHLLETLRRHGGDVSATAAELEVSTDSLYRAAARDATLGVAFRALSQGRAGARRAGVEARVRAARTRRSAPQDSDTDTRK